MKALMLLCGYPASGKTTLATTLSKIWKTMDIEVAVISVDALQTREQFTPSDWRNAREKASKLVEASLTGKSEKTVVLLDDVMDYRSMRRPYYIMAAEYRAAYRLINVTCPPRVAQMRNMLREEGRIPEDVLNKTIERFQPPDGEKFQWERDTIVFDAVALDARSIDDCLELAQALLMEWSPAEKGVDARHLRRETGCHSNLSGVHALDVKLRSIISREMRRLRSINVGDRLADCARRSNDLRLRWLSAFKDPSNDPKDVDAAVEAFEKSIRKETKMP